MKLSQSDGRRGSDSMGKRTFYYRFVKSRKPELWSKFLKARQFRVSVVSVPALMA